MVLGRRISKNTLLNFFLIYNHNKKNLLIYRNFLKSKITRTAPITSLCFTFFNLVNRVKAAETSNDLDEAIAVSDEFFLNGKFNDSLKALEPFKDLEDAEVLWRISRALYNLSMRKDIKRSEISSLINEAYEHIDKALKLNPDHYAVHKWMAILVDAKSSLDGIKARIKSLPDFKYHLMTAIELNPKDATSIFLLGQYMYNIADMSWLQRSLAKTLFGNPPEATFEEAFYYFSKAEETEPNFYSANLLMLGKTCLKLQKIETGCFWLRCAAAYPVRTDEDVAVRLEAEELLYKYSGVKEPAKEQESQEPQETQETSKS